MLNYRLEDPFIRQILHERKRGYGFVPLLGSGLSAPSGIPIIRDVQRYLDKCIFLTYDEKDPWDARKDPWPPLDGIKESAKNTTWAETICNDFKAAIQKGDQPSELQSAVLGALGDWRAALQLVSRIRTSRDSHGQHKIELETPADYVIDSFFNHLTGGKHPSLAHKMLAQLADTLRFQTIITTNFDSLIENSFASMALPLELYEVHRDGLLPDPSLVLKQRSIVKMNGGRFEIIAGVTLDQEPSEADKRTFVGYLKAAQHTGIDNHLLVMATSGRERRTVGLIGHALATLPRLRVFWVHYGCDGRELTPEDVSSLLDSIPTKYHSRMVFTSRPDLGMFLLQLYEQRYLSLPPSGADFPALWRLPAYRCELIHVRNFNANAKELREAIGPPFIEIASPSPEAILVMKGEVGLSSVAADVFLELEPKLHAIWLELDQFADMEQFYVALLQAVFAKVGRSSQLSVVTHLDFEGCGRQLKECKSWALNDFVIFINAREGAGRNVGRTWKRWSSNAQKSFWKALREFSRIGYRFIVLTDRAFPAATGECVPYKGKSVKARGAEVVNAVMDRLARRGKDAHLKQRFLYALTLMRNSRHVPVLLSWPFVKAMKPFDFEDNDGERKRLVFSWLNELHELSAIRFQRAGSVWLHAAIRERLRTRLLEKYPWLLGETQTIHQGIADWYVKLFRTCNDPQAVLESLYHRLQCILAGSPPHAQTPESLAIQQSAIIEALGSLELARDRILSCGYFCASEKAVEELACAIQESINSSKGQMLWARCQELIRDFSRQITQFRTANEANQKLYRFLPVAILAKPGPAIPDSRNSNRALSLQSEEAAILTGIRSYGLAEDRLEAFFTGAQADQSGDFWPMKKERNAAALREKAREWAIKVSTANPELLHLTVQALRRFVLLELLRGQARLMTTRSLKEEAKHHIRAERAYSIAAEMMRFVEDGEVLSIENAYLRTHMGVALARLGRFYEAHRRLNEASGYLSRSRKATDAMAWAVLDIRRAEVWFTAYERQKRASLRERVGLLQDSWSSLQRAEARLVGHRQDIWWWTLVYELQVRICRALIELSAFPRRRGDLDTASLRSVMRKHVDSCLGLAKAEMRLISIDVFRQARLVDELEAIVKRPEGKKLRTLLKDAREHLRTVKHERHKELGGFPLDKDLRAYVARVSHGRRKPPSEPRRQMPPGQLDATKRTPKSPQ